MITSIWHLGMRTSSICNSRLNAAIVWPELANGGLTMSGYVALRCCSRLAGA